MNRLERFVLAGEVGGYVRNNRCPSHLVNNPFHFSLEKTATSGGSC